MSWLFWLCVCKQSSIFASIFLSGRAGECLANHAPTIYRDPYLTFTIMLPARHEEGIFRRTIQKVYALNYPKELMQIIAICRVDDTGTIAEAQASINELGDPNVQLLIFNDYPINKPHGLNLALQIARGDVVTIFDAEDEPHADILNVINTTMLNEEVDAVQSGVQLMNHNTKWFCLNVWSIFSGLNRRCTFFACWHDSSGRQYSFCVPYFDGAAWRLGREVPDRRCRLGIRLCLAHARYG